MQALNIERSVSVLHDHLVHAEPGYIAPTDTTNFKFARTVLKSAKKQQIPLPDVGSIPGVCRFCRGRRGRITKNSNRISPFAYDVCDECFIDEYRAALESTVKTGYRRDAATNKSAEYLIVLAPTGTVLNGNTHTTTHNVSTITLEVTNIGIVLSLGNREYNVYHDEINTVPLPVDYPGRNKFYHQMLLVPADVFTLMNIPSAVTVALGVGIPICHTAFVSGTPCSTYVRHIPPSMRYLEVNPTSKTLCNTKEKYSIDLELGQRPPVLHTKCAGCMGVTPLPPATPPDYQLHADHPMYIIYKKCMALRVKVRKLKSELPARIVDPSSYLTQTEINAILPDSEDFF